MKNSRHCIYLIFLLGLFSVSLFAVDFGLSSSEKVQIETESFLRHSGWTTEFQNNGVVTAYKDSSSIKVTVIALHSDDLPQGVVCYISTSDTPIYDSLSQDLASFGSLYNTAINIIRR